MRHHGPPDDTSLTHCLRIWLSDCCHSRLLECRRHDRSEARMNDATRRSFLGLVSAGATTLLPARHAQAAAETGVASAIDDACMLTPQSEEGPYYLDPKLVRADIAEGRPGVPLAFRLRVIEAGACM